jgi:K(+)-stimulated pyrophosphate-energized sodium pump
LDSVENDSSNWKRICYCFGSIDITGFIAAYVCSRVDGINIFKAPVLAMLFVGGMIPVVFCFGHEFGGESSYGYGV